MCCVFANIRKIGAHQSILGMWTGAFLLFPANPQGWLAGPASVPDPALPAYCVIIMLSD
jgi:hypothetical protein